MTTMWNIIRIYNTVREGVKNPQRGGGPINLATFGRRYVTPPKNAAYQMYPLENVAMV